MGGVYAAGARREVELARAPRERVPGGGEGQVKVKVKGVAPCAAEVCVAPLPGTWARAPRERVPGGGEGQAKVKVKVKGVAPCAAEIWVAPLPPQVGHLIALKLLSESDRRLKDRVDLQALFAVCTPDQLSRAAVGVALIEQRGFHRDKDLPALLRQWTAQERPDLAPHLP